MRHWFRSGWSEWWIDERPPSMTPVVAGARIDEVRCHDVHDAGELILRIFDEETGVQVNRLLEGEDRAYALHQVSPAERHRQVAWMIATRRLRVWRRVTPSPSAAGGGASSSATAARSRLPQASPARAADGPEVAAPAFTAPPLFWYEFILKDELGAGLPGVAVELTTPAGRQRLATNDAGSVRVENAPAGQGSARIDRQSLEIALEDRAGRPRRKSKPPSETADFKVVTPVRADRVFSFAHQQPHRVMVVSRTDLLVAGSDARWRDLDLADESRESCRFTPGELDLLHLCSRGRGEPGQVSGNVPPSPEPPPDSSGAAARAAATQAAYVVKRGDSFWRIAEKMLGDGRRFPEIRIANADLMRHRPPDLIHPGDILRIPVEPAVGLIPSPGPWPSADETPPPPFIAMDVDGLHEALFDRVGQRMFETVTGPLVRLPAAPEPSSDPPEPAAAAAAVLASVVALEQGVPVEELFQPFDIPVFDPVERAGPSKR